MDRERSFYPTVLAVVATYYALFAVMAGSARALLSEAVPIAVFLLAAVTGFKKGLWWVVIGLVGHGLFDFVHRGFISNPGVPAWWPGWCMAIHAERQRNSHLTVFCFTPALMDHRLTI